ncbi:MAG: hypothetical protein RL226_1499 [Bacteroidota bacterium]|jgi:VanZ family protein
MLWRHLIWSLVWAALIAFMYFVPGKDLPVVSFWDVFGFDKVGHFVVFAIFSLILKTGLRRQIKFGKVRRLAMRWTLWITIPYGGILEFLQGQLIPDRTSDWLDFVANVLGVLFGLVIFRLIYGKQ